MSQQTATTRAAIVAALRAVPGIGAVHDHEPYANQNTTLRALYVVQTDDGEQLRGWYVRRVSFRVLRNGGGLPRVFTTWQIRGFMALAEEAGSELAFDALVDAVRGAFDADPSMSGAVLSTLSADGEVGAQLSASGPVMFAGVLCHAADLTLTTETIE
jgi:hypothetical protein